MQWDATENGGFSRGRPWLPLDPSYPSANVEVLSREPRSILTLYRRLIELRRRHLALSVGSYVPLAAQGDVLAYVRQRGTEKLVVVLNLSPRPQPFRLPNGDSRGRLLLSTHLDRDEADLGSEVELRPDEGVIVALQN